MIKKSEEEDRRTKLGEIVSEDEYSTDEDRDDEVDNASNSSASVEYGRRGNSSVKSVIDDELHVIGVDMFSPSPAPRSEDPSTIHPRARSVTSGLRSDALNHRYWSSPFDSHRHHSGSKIVSTCFAKLFSSTVESTFAGLDASLLETPSGHIETSERAAAMDRQRGRADSSDLQLVKRRRIEPRLTPAPNHESEVLRASAKRTRASTDDLDNPEATAKRIRLRAREQSPAFRLNKPSIELVARPSSYVQTCATETDVDRTMERDVTESFVGLSNDEQGRAANTDMEDSFGDVVRESSETCKVEDLEAGKTKTLKDLEATRVQTRRDLEAERDYALKRPKDERDKKYQHLEIEQGKEHYHAESEQEKNKPIHDSKLAIQQRPEIPVTSRPNSTVDQIMEDVSSSFESHSWLNHLAISRMMEMFHLPNCRYVESPSDGHAWWKGKQINENDRKIFTALCRQRHWHLVCVDRDRGTVTIYNSLLWTRSRSQVEEELPHLLRALGLQAKDFKMILNARVPQQPNANDCGIHVLLNALHIMAGLSVPTEHDGRLWRQILASAARKTTLSDSDTRDFVRKPLLVSINPLRMTPEAFAALKQDARKKTQASREHAEEAFKLVGMLLADIQRHDHTLKERQKSRAHDLEQFTKIREMIGTVSSGDARDQMTMSLSNNIRQAQDDLKGIEKELGGPASTAQSMIQVWGNIKRLLVALNSELMDESG